MEEKSVAVDEDLSNGKCGSQSSQLIKGSTEDGVTQEMLASQPEVIWLWYQAAALANPEPLEH